MTEFFEGIEGNWRKAELYSVLDDPDWGKGYWRMIHKYQDTVTVYKDGDYFVIPEKHEPQPDIWEKFVPVPIVPTEPGIYYDKDGDLWLKPLSQPIVCLANNLERYYDASIIGLEAKNYLPFTRVPGWPVADENEED